MNNSLLGGQFCTDSVNIQQTGNDDIRRERLAIIPRLNFTCNGTITSIRARVRGFQIGGSNNNVAISFQVWRPTSVNSTIYNKTGEVKLQSDTQVTGSGTYRTATIILTGNDTIEFQSGDVVGYYHPPDARYQVVTIKTDGYILYRFDGLPSISVNLNNANNINNINMNRGDTRRQPLLQLTIGKY